MKIVSWQSVLTDHQAYTMLELQKVAQEPVLIVSGVKELKERREQGWIAPDTCDMDVQYLPKSGWWRKGVEILDANRDAIHLFNGLWADRRFFILLLEAQRKGIRTALKTEPYAEVAAGYLSEDASWGIKIKAFIRPWLYRFGGFLVARKLLALFAISEKAVQQFSRIGVCKDKIFPFGYFVPGIEVDTLKGVGLNGQIRLVYVGSLIKIKGIHTLVRAMSLCDRKGIDIHLDIYGPGDEKKLKYARNTRYKGVIPFGKAQEVIAKYDVLVLPSQHDGWGVVVNEALLQGVPVIVSDQVGAKALVEKSGAGIVVKANDAEEFAASFEMLLRSQGVILEWKRRAESFRGSLSPEVAAEYMYDSLLFVTKEKGKKAGNPWYANEL